MLQVIDTHPHVISDDLEKYPLAPIGGKLSKYAEQYRITIETFIKMMDEANVTQSVLVQSSTGYGYDNSYCADAGARYPDRICPLGCIDATAPDAPEKARYWVKERGLVSLRLFTAGTTMSETDWLDKPITDPFFQEAIKLGISVCIQLRKTGLPMLYNVLQRYPSIPFVLDHMATPGFDDGVPYAKAQALWDLAQFPNLYLKVTTDNLNEANIGASTTQDLLKVLLERFGANRLMWGSNIPSVWERYMPGSSYKDMVDFARKTISFASEEDQKWFLADTARKVYPELVRRAR
jgi:predicted TIM-barrel fold metal-dependent hydrolase